MSGSLTLKYLWKNIGIDDLTEARIAYKKHKRQTPRTYPVLEGLTLFFFLLLLQHHSL